MNYTLEKLSKAPMPYGGFVQVWRVLKDDVIIGKITKISSIKASNAYRVNPSKLGSLIDYNHYKTLKEAATALYLERE